MTMKKEKQTMSNINIIEKNLNSKTSSDEDSELSLYDEGKPEGITTSAMERLYDVKNFT